MDKTISQLNSFKNIVESKLNKVEASTLSHAKLSQADLTMGGKNELSSEVRILDKTITELSTSESGEPYGDVGKNWRSILSPNDMIFVEWKKLINKGKYQLGITDEVCLLSDDFGQSWKKLTVPSGISDCAMTSDGKYIYVILKTGKIYYSSDFGEYFRSVASTSDSLNRKIHIDEGINFVMYYVYGDNKFYYNPEFESFITDNSVRKNLGSNIISVCEKDESECYVVLEDGLYTFSKSTKVLTNVNNNVYRNFIKRGVFYLYSMDNNIYSTTDFLSVSTNNFDEDIVSFDSSTDMGCVVVSTSDRSIFVSKDQIDSFQKITWNFVFSDINQINNHVVISPDGNYLTIATPYTILTSVDQGATVVENTTVYNNSDLFFENVLPCFNSNNEEYSVCQIKNGIGVLSRHRTLYVTRNGGKSWSLILSLGLIEGVYSCNVSSNGTEMIVVGENFLYVSQNSGLKWTQINNPGSSYRKSYIENRTIILASTDTIIKSTDLGLSWNTIWTLPAITGETIYISGFDFHPIYGIYIWTYNETSGSSKIYNYDDENKTIVELETGPIFGRVINFGYRTDSSIQDWYYATPSIIYINDPEEPIQFQPSVFLNTATTFIKVVIVGTRILTNLQLQNYSYETWKWTDYASVNTKNVCVLDLDNITKELKVAIIDTNGDSYLVDIDGICYYSSYTNIQLYKTNILINNNVFKYNMFGKLITSQTGQTQVCTSMFGGLAVSKNSGKTWFRSFVNYEYIPIMYYSSISGNGNIIVVLGFIGNGEYQGSSGTISQQPFSSLISRDGGYTFDIMNNPKYLWIATSCSFNGKYISLLSIDGHVVVSDDYGETWKDNNILKLYLETVRKRRIPPQEFTDTYTLFGKQVFTSNSGEIMKVMTINGVIIGSRDFGKTWNVEQQFNLLTMFGSMSGDGRVFTLTTCSYEQFLGYDLPSMEGNNDNLIVGEVLNEFASGFSNVLETNFLNNERGVQRGWNIVVSQDYGKTFFISSGFSREQHTIYNVCVSQDGRHQIAIFNGGIYSSNDYGNSFQISNVDNPLFNDMYLYITSYNNGRVFKTMSVIGNVIENVNSNEETMTNYKTEIVGKSEEEHITEVYINPDRELGSDFYQLETFGRSFNVVLPSINKLNPPVRTITLAFRNTFDEAGVKITADPKDLIISTLESPSSELFLSDTNIITLTSNGESKWFVKRRGTMTPG